MQRLKAYHWPGNIRQLLNALELAKALCSNGKIHVEDLPEEVLASPPPASDGIAAQAGSDYDTLEQLLIKEKWNVSAVARGLGVDRTTVHRRMKRLGLAPPNQR